MGLLVENQLLSIRPSQGWVGEAGAIFSFVLFLREKRLHGSLVMLIRLAAGGALVGDRLPRCLRRYK